MEEIEAEQEDVTAETSRRLACDCSVAHWLEDEDGNTLNIGRKSRTIPPAIRRALIHRDKGCRFPGCTAHKHTDAHQRAPDTEPTAARPNWKISSPSAATTTVPSTKAASRSR